MNWVLLTYPDLFGSARWHALNILIHTFFTSARAVEAISIWFILDLGIESRLCVKKYSASVFSDSLIRSSCGCGRAIVNVCIGGTILVAPPASSWGAFLGS